LLRKCSDECADRRILDPRGVGSGRPNSPQLQSVETLDSRKATHMERDSASIARLDHRYRGDRGFLPDEILFARRTSVPRSWLQRTGADLWISWRLYLCSVLCSCNPSAGRSGGA